MNWFRRWWEIRKLKELEREKLHQMMRAGYQASMGSPARLREERRLETEVDEIREQIRELKAVER